MQITAKALVEMEQQLLICPTKQVLIIGTKLGISGRKS
jgi:hypothetical protein